MSRREFIQQNGATCANWNWSWSFVNDAERFVIFGAWDDLTEGDRVLILSEGWERTSKGRRNAGYSQAREHIRLIEEKGYELKTFPMLISHEKRDPNGEGPATIKGFLPQLSTRRLVREGNAWYAIPR